MTTLRLKVITAPKEENAPFIVVHTKGALSLMCKLQQVECWDSDQEKMYWRWEDVELAASDAPDFEETSI